MEERFLSTKQFICSSIVGKRFCIFLGGLLMIIHSVNSFARTSPQRVEVGKFHSRGLWTSTSTKKKMPVLIMLPGSGPNGPEEMIPGQMTVDKKDCSIFEPIAKPFVEASWNVLQLGKPGIEFHSSWDEANRFYDKNLYMNLKWNQLVENLEEAINFVKSKEGVNSEQIYILGHSQGTQIAVDYASLHKTGIKGLILLGYSGEDYKTILEWQQIKRPIEDFIATDVDKGKKGYVTREEISAWPDPIDLDGYTFHWNLKKGKDRLSYEEIEASLRSDESNKNLIKFYKESKFLGNGIYDRGPIFKKTADLNVPLYIYTGDMDLLTPPREALEVKRFCQERSKKDCEVKILKGLGHGFSPPRGPRKHPLLDITVGPVDEIFVEELKSLVVRLYK
jgi:pimeloyl-ACP methyl ester carboxylesterase